MHENFQSASPTEPEIARQQWSHTDTNKLRGPGDGVNQLTRGSLEPPLRARDRTKPLVLVTGSGG
jgi:hypothetical protein